MRSIIDVKADLASLAIAEGAAWPAERVAAISNALAQPSPVDGIVAAYRELRTLEAPSALARYALKGLAEQIVAGQFHGLASEAAETLADVADATDPRAPSVPPMTPAPGAP